MTGAPTEVLGREEFRSRLESLSARYWDDHPFHRALHEGALRKEDLQLWAANRWYYQRMLPRKDAAILSNCPDREVRRQWISRVTHHDGQPGQEGGMDRWLRLAEATGLDEETVRSERLLLPGVRFAVDAYVEFARCRPWQEAVASGLTEMFAPGLMRRRVLAMREHYPWLDGGALDYFLTRIEVTGPEGAATLDLVLTHCRDRGSQDAAVAALAFKCEVLNAMLDAIDHAARRPAVTS
ncbi:pyrroloquinoline quinone biosynthesis protein PqqC [Actinoalloteichus sp. AHMU CJ021]|uniref:Pyrroloquinoline-quinone synthase n=1 Tax=Actinoalloteichus caeruleus DSM 43889 TaxID=1120930 RepID=A0ABT1JIN0_ACTCY|nr:pyrroloquinoline-quinone synthase PqqC [Actinoalloteichus caeruleus]AUS78307.1 pyrroloquinoline quinone biosynthesis protein PqqC [Actinoalloteichus sp. AHMU CJ021]MCP2332376.1 pyrroloquinoline-quinone synthase [Actinoalloteichus caeruleus DSM 43889]